MPCCPSNAVTLELKVRYGSEMTLLNKSVLASLTAALLNRGTQTRTYAQIKSWLSSSRSA